MDEPNRTVEVIERTRISDGYIKIDRVTLRHGQFAGGMGAPITREVGERGHAAGVLPYDPRRDEVMLIEQFRVGAYLAGWDAWLHEVVAGIIDPGETPEAVARREAIEEAGCTIARLEPIADLVLSPGALTETLKLYCGETDTAGVGGVHGLDHEGEDIRATAMPVDQALHMLARGEITNAPTVIAVQWLALNRSAMRARWRQ